MDKGTTTRDIPTKNETRLKLLSTQREYAFREIQILYDLSCLVATDQSKLGQFKCRHKRLDSLRHEYLEITSEINSVKLLINPNNAIDMQAVDAFDNMYYAVMEAAEAFLPSTSNEGPATMRGELAGICKPISQARLPQIDLIKFNGNIEHWQTFYDTFESLVHNNQNISNIEKFHYLLSCLIGPALSIAKGIPVTADNYKIVFDALVDRYQNKRILAVNYLEKICNHSILKSDDLHDLRELTSLFQESVNALKSLKIENLGEFILFYLSSRKLDSETRKRFELQNVKNIPTFTDLLSFLQGYIKILEASEPSAGFMNNGKALQSLRKNNSNNIYPTRAARQSFPTHCIDNENTGPYSESTYSEVYRCPNSGTYLEAGPSINNNYCSDNYDYHQNAEVHALATSGFNNKYASCACCGCSHHTIYKCPVFHDMNLNERENIAKNKNLCGNCLRPSHTADKCFSKSCCTKCNGRHHTLLHRDQGVTAAHPVVSFAPVIRESSSEPIVATNSTNSNVYLGHGRAQVLLGTSVVRARGPNGVMNIRVLIDSGAQDCFITLSCAQRLGLPLRRCNITVAGLGQSAVHEIKGMTSLTIQPQHSDKPNFYLQPIIMKTITHKMPSVEVPETVKVHYKHLVLADSNFDKSADIDLLIGAELFHHIYDGRRLEVGPGLPVALHSVFGWIITGKLDPECRPPTLTTNLLASTLTLDKVVKQFWEVEEPPQLKIENPENDACEQLYTNLVQRNDDGRYVVPILLKENHKELGGSFHTSLSRLYNLEKRFLHNPKLKCDYATFMQEYEDLKHMREVKPTDKDLNYIIPHHCVLRPDSATTKLRVVFDASAKSTNGLSLNDIVHVGPKLQTDIVDIITKFRLHKVVFTADISKMYRNIELRPEDRKYQHILWRSSPTEDVQEFELQTVTYGVSSSPYLAIRTLHQLANDHGDKWPQAAEIIRKDTFMDDITAGASSLEGALDLKNQLIQLLNCGKFELRKWTSNSPEFLEILPSEYCQTPKSFCDDSNQQMLKVLGVQWDPNEDVFTYSQSRLSVQNTKRSILSVIARIYDPLGWLTPMVLLAKLLIQNLWRLQLGWDDPVPPDVANQWSIFVEGLRHLNEVKIPRHILPPDSICTLIGFSDGSSKGYGCCVYLRCIKNEKVTVSLVMAKSKVAPIKPLTINRLELLGAVLLARVLKHVADLLRPHVYFKNVLAFTDSTTVLAWLNTEPYKLKTFVSHRVVKISEDIAPENWHHVSTHDNPSDHSSRGLSCLQLVSTSLWWSGPSWLTCEESKWPKSLERLPTENIPETRNLTHLVHAAESTFSDDEHPVTKLLEHCSSLSKAQRVMAWCVRFGSRSRKRTQVSGGLTTQELESSLSLFVKHEQNKFFADEKRAVACREVCARPIQKLNPFIDHLGLLRVGGRLENSPLPLSAIYPIMLPKHSRLSVLIIDFYHRLHLHCGPRTLQSIIQRNYWILGIRNLIRSRIAKCVTCFKVNPKPVYPLMGNLPLPRVQPTRCFQNIGVDFAGPYVVKESRRRNAHTYKVYVCVMVCLAVKAIHLDLVTELSTPAFIAALNRFVSRRGLCKLIISDCGTNFIGAKRYLGEVQRFLLANRLELSSELAKRNIVWQTNPPTASNFGGIFESGVKSMKHHLKRVVGLQVLTYEELVTVLNKVEAVLNSRPLCALSSDPAEVDVLTPGHFLVGGPLVSLPEMPLTETYLPPRERWQMLQKLTQSFWKIWVSQYLHTQQQRSKWFKGQANIQIGDIVTIVDQNLPPLEWRFGRVMELHPGSDGVVRVVTLRTANGVLRRPVNKTCPLPLSL